MTASTQPAAPTELSLLSRAMGVITAPRTTMERVVANPRPVGILFVVAVVVAVAAATPVFTTAGQQAVLDMQVQAAQNSGRPMSPEQQAMLERFAPYFGYFTLGQVVIFLPIFTMVVAALSWVAFNTIMGGTASFKQVLAVVTHSQVLGALGAVLGAPIQLIQSTFAPGGPFNLGALLPMLDPGSTLARFLGITSVFTVWGFVVMGIGLGVLYRRKSANVVMGLLVAYAVIAYGLLSLFSGGSGR